MVDPMPTFDGTEPANLKTINNGNASAADAIHQGMLDQIHADDAVATVEDLPDTGNWLGRRVFVVDDQLLFVCTALPAVWVREEQLGYAETTPTMGAGFDNVDFNDLLRQGGFAYYNVNARRVSDLAIGGTIAQIPGGYRGNLHDWRWAWGDTTGPATHTPYEVFYNPIAHEIQTRMLIPAGTYIAASFMWPLSYT